MRGEEIENVFIDNGMVFFVQDFVPPLLITILFDILISGSFQPDFRPLPSFFVSSHWIIFSTGKKNR